MMLFIFAQLSGLNDVLSYMEIILERSRFNLIESSSVVTYALIVSMVSSVMVIGFFDSCGRRVLFVLSSLGVTLAHIGLGTHFVLLDSGVVFQWLPAASMFLFISAFSCGLGSVPSVVSSEVYTANVKPVAACIGNLTAAGAAFLASKTYQPLVDLFGEGWVFYGHAVVTFLAVPYAMFYMPETKGKTLQQIQDDLINK